MSNEDQSEAPATNPSTSEESTLFNVSIRSWTLLLLVLTVCIMSVTGIEVKEPLYTLVGLAVGFYFGQKTKGTK